MAGDWIKMRNDLLEDPSVFKLSSLTKLDRMAVAGRLYAFWSWADKHAVDGRVDGASSTVIDDITRHDGFSDALVSVKWLEIGEDFICIPKHDRHNGESAKERSLKNARQARWREGKTKDSSTDVDGKASTQTSTDASTREEKRREEKKGSAVARGTRLPEDWHPSVEDTAFCKTERPDLRPSEVAQSFLDYWISIPGSKGCKLDWSATWRNWVRAQRAGTKPAQPNQEKQKWD